MPVVIRQLIEGRAKNHSELAADSWDLRTQIEALEEWLSANPGQLDPSCRWIADLGFTVRLDATGGGPPISRTLMKMCVASNLEIWLSEYGLSEYGLSEYGAEHDSEAIKTMTSARWRCPPTGG